MMAYGGLALSTTAGKQDVSSVVLWCRNRGSTHYHQLRSRSWKCTTITPTCQHTPPCSLPPPMSPEPNAELTSTNPPISGCLSISSKNARAFWSLPT